MDHSKSQAAFTEAKQYIPGGVNSPVRSFRSVGGVPPVIAKGSGSKLTDIDGNEYIDYVLSYGPLLLGHAHLTIGLCGDLKFGRTVHSLIKTMARCQNIRFVLISPEELRVPDYIINDVLEANGIEYRETRSLEESMLELDILYMTRVQKERFFNEEDYIRLKNSYILTSEKMSLAKPEMAVLHPLPRVNEIALDVDNDPRAAYFEQVQNGVYIRMALIMTLLGLADPKAPKEGN